MSDRAVLTEIKSDPLVASNLRRVGKGALVGFFEIHVPAWGIVFHDCKWFRTNKGEWIGLPSSSFKNRDGQTVWKNLVEVSDKDADRYFRDRALAAVRRIATGAS